MTCREAKGPGIVSAIDKALGMLSLFSEEEPRWTVESASERLNIPVSTAYRYVRSLSRAGLINDLVPGGYTIGPGIIALDRLARQTDPLIQAARESLDILYDGCPETIVLLSRMFKSRVMCVDRRPHGADPSNLSYERGRPMPLYRGAVSKIILAFQSPRTLAGYFERDRAEIIGAGLGVDQADFVSKLREIRRNGYCVSRGEVDPGIAGISTPVFSPSGECFASVSLVMRDRIDIHEDIQRLTRCLLDTAGKITASLTQTRLPVDARP